MIVQIRGTSGSGKTTVMREVMNALCPFDEWEKEYIDGRRKPLSYKYRQYYVLGHYEIDCGGCDTIGSAPKVYEQYQVILKNWDGRKACVILSEGLLLSEDVIWTQKLFEQSHDVRALFLTTPTDTCLERVTKRQAGRAPVDPERVVRKLTRRVETIERARKRLVNARVYCKRASSVQASKIILDWITHA